MATSGCSDNPKNITQDLHDSSGITADTSLKLAIDQSGPDSSVYGTYNLPLKKRSKDDIDALVRNIDLIINRKEFEYTSDFGVYDGPCRVDKYHIGNKIIKLRYGCGDCSNLMTRREFYFDNNELIKVIDNFVTYYYYPCATDEQLFEELGIKPEDKDSLTRRRTDTYYLLDKKSADFNRTGDSLHKAFVDDGIYLKSDNEDLIKVVNELIMYKEPKY